jgi:hypothetical protein
MLSGVKRMVGLDMPALVHEMCDVSSSQQLFHRCRRHRRVEQRLLKQPLIQHMERLRPLGLLQEIRMIICNSCTSEIEIASLIKTSSSDLEKACQPLDLIAQTHS